MSPAEVDILAADCERSMARKRVATLPGYAVAIIDAILINAGFGLAWFLRYELQIGREVAASNFLPLGDYTDRKSVV